MRNIGRSNNDDNNNNKQIQNNNYCIWLIAYMPIGLAISFVVPFPISFVIALFVFCLFNVVRMHIALKRQGMTVKSKNCMNRDPHHLETVGSITVYLEVAVWHI